MNYYKFSTLLLALALIITWYLSYFSGSTSQQTPSFTDEKGNRVEITQEMLDDLEAFNDLMEIDEATFQQWKQSHKEIDSVTTGKPLSPGTAGKHLKSFKKWNDKPSGSKRKFKIQPYGFAFGKYRLRKLLDAIDSTNDAVTTRGNLDSLIYGVRVNLTHTFGKADTTLDVVFVPIMQNGNNFIFLGNGDTKDIGSTSSTNLLLNTSFPCPTICNQ